MTSVSDITNQLAELLGTQLKPLQELIASQAEQIKALEQKLESIKPALLQPNATPTPLHGSSGRTTPEQPTELSGGMDVIHPTPLPGNRPSEKLPDPPEFTGKARALYPFLSKLRYKLEGNADRYPTPRLRFLYAHSRLGGDAATLVRPLLDTDIKTVEQLVAFLEATYEDPNRKDTATTYLLNLRQGNKKFLSHFAEFRRLAADTDLNEAGLVSQLKRSLTPELLQAMIGVKVPGSLNEYANLIVSYDNDLRYLSRAPRTSKHRQVTRTSQSVVRHPDAIDLDNIHHGYAPKGSNERERRWKHGLCFNCGRKGHMSPTCNEPTPFSRTNIRNTTTQSEPRGRRSRKSSRHSSHRSSRRSSTQSSRPSQQSPKARSRQ